jgi:hypothetical protein
VSSSEFKDWNLHDAELIYITLEWGNSKVHAKVLAYLSGGKQPEEIVILWESVSNFQIPHYSPWGDSLYIFSTNMEELSNDSYRYSIEMGSGDIITIDAKTVRLMQFKDFSVKDSINRHGR